MAKTKNAFVLMHFGSDKKYFEMELYFCIMIRQCTSNNLIYMYSEQDTPQSFVNAISPFVYLTKGFDDMGVTYNVAFQSTYESFNIFRTCNFIFAYALVEYERVCIVESDLVVMGNIDSIFNLNCPAVLCYNSGDINLNTNIEIRQNPNVTLQNCKEKSGLNGGVMLFEPNMQMFRYYLNSLQIIANEKCKYPNESLFEYANRTFYNLPVIYNLSHYHTLNLKNYGIKHPNEVMVFHFNETKFKCLDIVKDNWLEQNIGNEQVKRKYRVKQIPILYFKHKIYEPNVELVQQILNTMSQTHESSHLNSKMSQLSLGCGSNTHRIRQIFNSEMALGVQMAKGEPFVNGVVYLAQRISKPSEQLLVYSDADMGMVAILKRTCQTPANGGQDCTWWQAIHPPFGDVRTNYVFGVCQFGKYVWYPTRLQHEDFVWAFPEWFSAGSKVVGGRRRKRRHTRRVRKRSGGTKRGRSGSSSSGSSSSGPKVRRRQDSPSPPQQQQSEPMDESLSGMDEAFGNLNPYSDSSSGSEYMTSEEAKEAFNALQPQPVPPDHQIKRDRVYLIRNRVQRSGNRSIVLERMIHEIGIDEPKYSYPYLRVMMWRKPQESLEWNVFEYPARPPKLSEQDRRTMEIVGIMPPETEWLFLQAYEDVKW